MLLALRHRISLLWSRLSSDGQLAASTWVIDADRRGLRDRAVEFWRFRRILWFFAVRTLARRYEGTALGKFWLFARPLAPILISTLIFGSLLKVASDGIPYFLFFLVGTTSWMLFEMSLMWATRSLDMNKGLIRKVYFPRLIVPVASVASSLFDALIYSTLILVGAGYYFLKDGRWFLQLDRDTPLALLAGALSVVFGLALGLWTSVWQVKYRDVRFGLRYFMRFWFYLTPVIYPFSEVPAQYRWLVWINPMAAYVETFKWGILGTGALYPWPFASATLTVAIVLLGGIWYFGRVEAASVDAM